MSTIIETAQAVTSSARTHANPKPRVITKETTLPYGYTIRQGDVMITRHPLDTDFGEVLPSKQAQLAPGSTVGSRHVVRKGPKLFVRKTATVLQGPIIKAPKGLYVEHPVHAHVDCRLPGAYEVTYPRDLGAEGLQRRKD